MPDLKPVAVTPLNGREKRISSVGKHMLVEALEAVVDHGVYTYKIEYTMDPNNKNIGLAWTKATQNPKCLLCRIQEAPGRNGYKVKLFVDNGYNPEEMLAKLKAQVVKATAKMPKGSDQITPGEEPLSGISDDDMILFFWELSGQSLKAGKTMFIIGRRQLMAACTQFFNDNLEGTDGSERNALVELIIEEFIDADMIALAGKYDDGEIPWAYKITDKAKELIQQYEEIAAQSEFFFPDPKDFLKQYKKAAKYLQPRLEEANAALADFEEAGDVEGAEAALKLVTQLNDTRLLLITLWNRIRNLQ